MENYDEEYFRKFSRETEGLLKLFKARSNSRSNEVVEATYREILEISSTTNSSQEGRIVPAESFSSTSSSSSSLSEQFESSSSIRLGPPSSESLPPEEADVSEKLVTVEEGIIGKLTFSQKKTIQFIKNMKGLDYSSFKQAEELAKLRAIRSCPVSEIKNRLESSNYSTIEEEISDSLKNWSLSLKETNKIIKNFKSIKNPDVKQRINLAFNQLHTLRSPLSSASSSLSPLSSASSESVNRDCKIPNTDNFIHLLGQLHRRSIQKSSTLTSDPSVFFEWRELAEVNCKEYQQRSAVSSSSSSSPSSSSSSSCSSSSLSCLSVLETECKLEVDQASTKELINLIEYFIPKDNNDEGTETEASDNILWERETDSHTSTSTTSNTGHNTNEIHDLPFLVHANGNYNIVKLKTIRSYLRQGGKMSLPYALHHMMKYITEFHSHSDPAPEYLLPCERGNSFTRTAKKKKLFRLFFTRKAFLILSKLLSDNRRCCINCKAFLLCCGKRYLYNKIISPLCSGNKNQREQIISDKLKRMKDHQTKCQKDCCKDLNIDVFIKDVLNRYYPLYINSKEASNSTESSSGRKVTRIEESCIIIETFWNDATQNFQPFCFEVYRILFGIGPKRYSKLKKFFEEKHLNFTRNAKAMAEKTNYTISANFTPWNKIEAHVIEEIYDFLSANTTVNPGVSGSTGNRVQIFCNNPSFPTEKSLLKELNHRLSFMVSIVTLQKYLNEWKAIDGQKETKILKYNKGHNFCNLCKLLDGEIERANRLMNKEEEYIIQLEEVKRLHECYGNVIRHENNKDKKFAKALELQFIEEMRKNGGKDLPVHQLKYGNLPYIKMKGLDDARCYEIPRILRESHFVVSQYRIQISGCYNHTTDQGITYLRDETCGSKDQSHIQDQIALHSIEDNIGEQVLIYIFDCCSVNYCQLTIKMCMLLRDLGIGILYIINFYQQKMGKNQVDHLHGINRGTYVKRVNCFTVDDIGRFMEKIKAMNQKAFNRARIQEPLSLSLWPVLLNSLYDDIQWETDRTFKNWTKFDPHHIIVGGWDYHKLSKTEVNVITVNKNKSEESKSTSLYDYYRPYCEGLRDGYVRLLRRRDPKKNVLYTSGGGKYVDIIPTEPADFYVRPLHPFYEGTMPRFKFDDPPLEEQEGDAPRQEDALQEEGTIDWHSFVSIVEQNSFRLIELKMIKDSDCDSDSDLVLEYEFNWKLYNNIEELKMVYQEVYPSEFRDAKRAMAQGNDKKSWKVPSSRAGYENKLEELFKGLLRRTISSAAAYKKIERGELISQVPSTEIKHLDSLACAIVKEDNEYYCLLQDCNRQMRSNKKTKVTECTVNLTTLNNLGWNSSKLEHDANFNQEILDKKNDNYYLWNSNFSANSTMVARINRLSRRAIRQGEDFDNYPHPCVYNLLNKERSSLNHPLENYDQHIPEDENCLLPFGESEYDYEDRRPYLVTKHMLESSSFEASVRSKYNQRILISDVIIKLGEMNGVSLQKGKATPDLFRGDLIEINRSSRIWMRKQPIFNVETIEKRLDIGGVSQDLKTFYLDKRTKDFNFNAERYAIDSREICNDDNMGDESGGCRDSAKVRHAGYTREFEAYEEAYYSFRSSKEPLMKENHDQYLKIWEEHQLALSNAFTLRLENLYRSGELKSIIKEYKKGNEICRRRENGEFITVSLPPGDHINMTRLNDLAIFQWDENNKGYLVVKEFSRLLKQKIIAENRGVNEIQNNNDEWHLFELDDYIIWPLDLNSSPQLQTQNNNKALQMLIDDDIECHFEYRNKDYPLKLIFRKKVEEKEEAEYVDANSEDEIEQDKEKEEDDYYDDDLEDDESEGSEDEDEDEDEDEGEEKEEME